MDTLKKLKLTLNIIYSHISTLTYFVVLQYIL